MKETAALRRHILSRRATVAVLGLDYVGLSLACAAAEGGFPVCAIDADARLVGALADGAPAVSGVGEATLRKALDGGRLSFTTEIDPVRECDILCICLPAPTHLGAPDPPTVEQACKDVALHLKRGQLVVLEWTSYPGTTDEVVRPLLESSGLVVGRDVLLAYSPERIDPGNSGFGVRNTPRVIGGQSPEATGVAALFFGQLAEQVVVVSSCRSAEVVKLLENAFRHVNVALVNELAVLCNETGVDVWEVVRAAATKPFGFTSFSPGPGMGGRCVPVDPVHLAWQVRRDGGRQLRLLEDAQDVNGQMPAYVATRIGDALNEAGKTVKGASILVLGVAYKPEVADVRMSPALEVMNHLTRRRAHIDYHDPHVESVVVNGKVLKRTDLTRRAVATADCVAILTPHKEYDLQWIAQQASLVFDARGAYGRERPANVHAL